MDAQTQRALTEGVQRFLLKPENEPLLALCGELYAEALRLLDHEPLTDEARAQVTSAYEMICDEVAEEMDFWVWIGSSNRTGVDEADLPRIIIPAVAHALYTQQMTE